MMLLLQYLFVIFLFFFLIISRWLKDKPADRPVDKTALLMPH